MELNVSVTVLNYNKKLLKKHNFYSTFLRIDIDSGRNPTTVFRNTLLLLIQLLNLPSITAEID